VVQEHGGTVRCDGAPGRGATFTIQLPAAPDERAPARPATTPASVTP
jgi:signal transduction histidine kinase